MKREPPSARTVQKIQLLLYQAASQLAMRVHRVVLPLRVAVNAVIVLPVCIKRLLMVLMVVIIVELVNILEHLKVLIVHIVQQDATNR